MFKWIKNTASAENQENSVPVDLNPAASPPVPETPSSNNPSGESVQPADAPSEANAPEHVPLPVHPEQTALEQMLIAGDAFLARYAASSVFDGCIEGKTLLLDIEEIERSLKEFHSKMFFVVIFGPLKAGKSTMVNTLAHRYVSPTRLGKECTLRPTNVIQSEETSIEENFMRDNAQDRNQVFQFVIDYIRHMKDWEDVSPYVYKETSILNETNIENKLSHVVDVEPLITVIRVPGGKFIDSTTAIIDMPGLDGNISNLETSPVHHWVLRRTDFLIFIQSSISAISKTTNHFLERLLVESKNPPIWLVQNIIDGKYWRSLEERDAEALQQLSETREEIMRELDLKEMYSTPINLGMALDGVMNQNEQLLKTSQFAAFEERLYTVLQDKRIRIQERNSLHGLLRALRAARQEVRRIQDEIKTRQQEMNKLSLQLTQMETLISNHELFSPAHPRKTLELQLTNLLTSEEEGLGRLIEDRTEKTLLYCNRDITGEELVTNLIELGETIREKGNHLYLKTDGEFGVRIAQQVNAYIQRAEHLMEESLKEYQEKADELAAPLGVAFHWPLPEDLPPFDYTYLSPVMEKAFRLGKNLPSTKKMLLFDRHFNGQQAKIYIQGAAESIREQLKEQAERWVETLLDLHLNEIRKQRKQARLSLIAENRQRFQLKAEQYEKQAQQSRQLLNALEQDLEQMQSLAQTAQQTMKQVK